MTLYLGNEKISPISKGSGSGEAKTKFGLSIDSFIGNTDLNGVLSTPIIESSNLVFTGVTNLSSNALKYTFYGKSISSVNFSDLTSITGEMALYRAFSESTITLVSFPNLTTINASGVLQGAFQSCWGLSSVSFPNLVSISGQGAFSEAFAYGGSSSISFPKLELINGYDCMSNAFSGNNNLTYVSFDALETISGEHACQSMFAYCVNLERIDFPALTTISSEDDPFGSESWNYIFNECSNLTEIHFRADMASDISNITGYADKWGASNATIYFDLAACSVTFNVTPSAGTSIYFDGRLLDSSTVDTGTGDHTYMLVNNNYPIYSGVVSNLQIGDSITVTKDITSIVGNKVTINTNVENCTVTFNYGNYVESATTVTSTSYDSKSVYSETSTTVGYTVSKADYGTVTGTTTLSNQDVSINVTLKTNDVDLTNYSYTLDANDEAILTDYTGPDVQTLVLPNI